jgi:hypothetical protein
MNNNFKFSRAEHVEFMLNNANVHTFKTNTQPNLRHKKVVGIEVRASQLIDPNGVQNAANQNPAFRNSAFVTLVEKGNHEIVKNLPLSALVSDTPTQQRGIMQFNELIIDWEKSHINVPDLTTITPVLGMSVSMVVYYID